MTLISVFFLLCVYLCQCLCFCICLSLNSLPQFLFLSLSLSLSLPLSRQKEYFAIITYDDVHVVQRYIIMAFSKEIINCRRIYFCTTFITKCFMTSIFCITILFHRHIISAIVRIQSIQNECVMLCFECFANEFCHNKLKLKPQLAIPKDKCDCVPTKWCQQGFI